MLRNYLKCNGVIIPTKMARPASSAIATWVVCYKLRWNASRIDEIDQIVFTQLGRQACSQADMAQLRAAKTG